MPRKLRFLTRKSHVSKADKNSDLASSSTDHGDTETTSTAVQTDTVEVCTTELQTDTVEIRIYE